MSTTTPATDVSSGTGAKKFAPLLIVAVVAGGLGFVGGGAYAKHSRTAAFGARGGMMGDNVAFQRGTTGPGGGAGGQGRMMFRGQGAEAGGLVAGEILSKDEHGITVKLRDGGSKIVLTAESTTVSKPANIKLDELNVGETVMVVGKANDDGSVTAESIQVRPEGAFMMTTGVQNVSPGSDKDKK